MLLVSLREAAFLPLGSLFTIPPDCTRHGHAVVLAMELDEPGDVHAILDNNHAPACLLLHIARPDLIGKS
jgi:hypothetical protein